MRYASILLFAALFAFATIRWGVPHQVGVAYLVASVTSFVAYAMDKSAARAGRWRTSESTLLLLGLACGWPGAALAQQWL
ncbi:MAG: cold-shock protein, partial [Massilia sp.]|nr:cold-shock protein [Massilia sp.]